MGEGGLTQHKESRPFPDRRTPIVAGLATVGPKDMT